MQRPRRTAMFGGGNGSFGVAPAPNPFAAAQASPMNPFQGGGGFGTASSTGGFGGGSTTSGTAFGGRSGGRAPRGGRATQARGGGRAGGRITPHQGGNSFGTPTTSIGGGRGRGAGQAAAAESFGNPFATPSPPSSGVFGGTPSSATTFGQPGRGGGRSGGRESGGRGVAFGSGSSVQPNIRRKSDTGGRGPRTPGTGFGHIGNEGVFVPPLPPSSPPPSTSNRKQGRGGIVTPMSSLSSPPMAPVATTFGHQSGERQRSHVVGFHSDAGNVVDNPFVAASSSHAPFVTPDTAGSAFSDTKPRSARDRRQQNQGFVQYQGFQDPFHQTSAFEARMAGGKGRSQQLNQALDDQSVPSTSFGQNTRRRSQTNSISTSFGKPASEGTEGGSAVVPTLKTKKKTPRASPQPSPPSSTPGSPVLGSSGYQTIGDQKNKAELSSAKNLDGTCIDMCSPTERELHIRVDELSLFEKCFPGHPGQERELIVKRFQRSSADHKLDIPSELRPPGVLRQTQLYLEQQIMDRERLGPDPRFSTPRLPELIELYNFCWDRCRMIRKDFVLQNYRGAGGRVHPIAVDVHERIARYHILSEHELCEVPSFVAQQNMEQLGQTLKSLNELYDDSRKLGDPSYLSPFEAEFRGYFILCTLDNGRGSDVLKFVKGLAPQIREAPQVKFAMQVFVARHTQNYYLFFKLLRDATYLQACLVFRYIPSMRSQALERLNRAHRNQPYPLAGIAELLCFDDMDHAESVCSHHGLDISTSDESDRDGELMVNFGGDFESDIQLRQNKNPLPVRASHVFVGQKQGDFLRGEVCRGVTEYEQQEYPALSKLIEDTESRERSALYPDRPPYEDQFSAFTVYNSDPFELDEDQVGSHVRAKNSERFSSGQGRGMSFEDTYERKHELDEIAKRQAEVERTKIMMMQRIQQLEREKEAKARAQKIEVEKKREAEEKEARAKDEALKKQRELEEQKRVEEEDRTRKRLQEELEFQRRKEAERVAAEQARLAEARRIAEDKRLADEEQRRLALQKAEEERKRLAAIEAERRRQAELAAEQERRERERLRKAELEKEAARRKLLRQIQKQRIAVLKFRFHLWKKFKIHSKTLPSGVRIGVSSLVDQPPKKPADVIEWLFGGSRTALDFIGLHRRQFDQYELLQDEALQLPENFWQPLDVATLAGDSLQKSGHSVSRWKFVVADLMDEGLSSFGSWCAVKCGISSASIGEDENISTVHSTEWSGDFNITVCCRYLDSSFSRSLSSIGREKKLSGTSALLLPLDLCHTLDEGKLQRWEDRVHGLLSHMHPSRKIGVVVLGFCASNTRRKGDALAAAEASIGRIRNSFERKLSCIDGELILEEDLTSAHLVDSKVSAVLERLASGESQSEARQIVELSELLDAVVDGALQERSHNTESLDDIQERLHRNLWKLRDQLLSPRVIDVDFPIPELQASLGSPSFGWNSRDAQQKWDGIFKALTSHRIVTSFGAMSSLKVCEVYFEQISRMVDELFGGPIGARISTDELKRTLYDFLVPVHNEFLESGESTIQDSSRLLPWRQIFTQIYGTFVGCLDEELLYIPLEVYEDNVPHPQTNVPQSVISRRSRHRRSLDKEAQAAAVAFARNELKRALFDQAVPPAQANGIKRLRQEIVRDRAASQSFQQYLRREMVKWAGDEDLTLS